MKFRYMIGITQSLNYSNDQGQVFYTYMCTVIVAESLIKRV